jgi:hypothetical protein
MCPHTAIYVSSYCHICVLILLYTCPHTAIYVSSYCYIRVLILQPASASSSWARSLSSSCCLILSCEAVSNPICWQHAAAYVSIRQNTSAYVNIGEAVSKPICWSYSSSQHTSSYNSIRQHTAAYGSIRQHAAAYVSMAKPFGRTLPPPRRHSDQ